MKKNIQSEFKKKTKHFFKILLEHIMTIMVHVLRFLIRTKRWLQKVFKKSEPFRKVMVRHALPIIVSILLVLGGIILIWVGNLKVPDFSSFSERKIIRSTKIYDRTEEIVLFDVNKDVKRTLVKSEEISIHAKNAIVAIEDDRFYQHKGIEFTDTLRAVLINLSKGSLSQGGSTITQQVIKNTLLVQDKKISRKLKEWFLALKIEKELSKDEILTHYLNVVPYGGTLYGIQEASRSFFGKDALDLTLAESAYLAAIPNAPTYYSPYGNHKEELNRRKNLVLQRMLELGFINQEEHDQARNEEVEFLQQSESSIKALHFVQYVRSYLEERYGKDAVENEGLRVITTLDYELQQKGEEIILEQALINEEKWDASNAGLISIDANTGQILTMVGSRDYFDTEIDGNYNVTIAKRQPGSSFKPFVYATAFKKGYTPNTIVFDTRTQFTASCQPSNFTNNGDCYSPQNYDGKYDGPFTFRNALAQSRNVASVKVLYLAGLKDSLRTAKDMGISTLGNADRYGLTLVLGGGEVSLLDMTSAYSVFATGGIRNPHTAILRVEDAEGNILEEFTPRPQQVLDKQTTLLVSDVLSDNVARTPLYGASSFMYFGDRDIAAKTGTTNDYKDAWLIGYSPDVAVGVWTGNNDNTPMTRGSAISGAPWRAFMNEVLKKYPNSSFEEPAEIEGYDEMKPVFRGEWKGGESYAIDTISGKLATEFTPPETRKEIAIINPHSILHWVDIHDPQGPIPNNPSNNNQYGLWEFSVQNWINQNKYLLGVSSNEDKPSGYDNIHTEDSKPVISISKPSTTVSVTSSSQLTVEIEDEGSEYTIRKVNYFINGMFIGSSEHAKDFPLSFYPNEVDNLQNENEIRAVAIDEMYNRGEAVSTFMIR